MSVLCVQPQRVPWRTVVLARLVQTGTAFHAALVRSTFLELGKRRRKRCVGLNKDRVYTTIYLKINLPTGLSK